MPYVSAKFVMNPDTNEPTNIEAIDDRGRVWFVPGMDCDVGDWKEFLANGGTVEPYTEPTTE